MAHTLPMWQEWQRRWESRGKHCEPGWSDSCLPHSWKRENQNQDGSVRERGEGGDRDTHLAVVTLEVIILVHGHHPEDLLAALGTKRAPGF